MIKQLAYYNAIMLFWGSVIVISYIGCHPRIRNYTVSGKKLISFWQACTILFTSSYSGSLLYWSFFESVFLTNDPEFAKLFPSKVGNTAFSSALTLYDWVLSLYPLGFLGLIVALFVHLLSENTKKRFNRIFCVVSVFLACAAITKVAASTGSYLLPLQYLLGLVSPSLGTPFFIIFLLMIGVLFALFGGIISVKLTADITVQFVLIILTILAVKLYFLDGASDHVVKTLKEFVALTVNQDFLAAQFSFKNKFVQDWTVLIITHQELCAISSFYFLYVVLQGRSIKEVLLIWNCALVLPTVIIFGVNSTLVQVLATKYGAVLTPDNFLYMYEMIFRYINWGIFPIIIFFLAMFTLIVTTIDSTIYSSLRYLKIEKSPETKFLSLYTGGVVTLVILITGFLYYILSQKVKPAIIVRLYEINFWITPIMFFPILFITYKTLRHLHRKDIDNGSKIDL